MARPGLANTRESGGGRDGLVVFGRGGSGWCSRGFAEKEEGRAAGGLWDREGGCGRDGVGIWDGGGVYDWDVCGGEKGGVKKRWMDGVK